ncbi:MAG: hypothetical protein OEY49_02575 [Candidatus Heimdallarchaeota archaeon]|nr:hypothetical protein [Candidatus Heimdallarchaeota archaeon]
MNRVNSHNKFDQILDNLKLQITVFLNRNQFLFSDNQLEYIMVLIKENYVLDFWIRPRFVSKLKVDLSRLIRQISKKYNYTIEVNEILEVLQSYEPCPQLSYYNLYIS